MNVAWKPDTGQPERGWQGEPVGEPWGAHPYPPMLNTDGGFLHTTLPTPNREILISEGGRKCGVTEAREEDGRVRVNKGKEVIERVIGKVSEEKSQKVTISERKVGDKDNKRQSNVRLTERDIELLKWAARYGIVSREQVARRFWPAVPSGATAVKRRLRRLTEAGLLSAERMSHRPATAYLATAAGVRWANVPLRAARFVPWRARHDLALVDLSEVLLSQHLGAAWLTERELRSRALLEAHGLSSSYAYSRKPDGLLMLTDGRHFAIELDASLKERERLEQIVADYMLALRKRGSKLAGIRWYLLPGAGLAHAEYLRAALAKYALSEDVTVTLWEASA